MALLHLSLTLRQAIQSPEQDGDVVKLEASPHRSASRLEELKLYINATLEELNSRSNGSYPYADDNTLRYHARHKESKPEFVSRMCQVLASVEKAYHKIKGVLSKEKSDLLPVFQKME
jgi:hypothetical protein